MLLSALLLAALPLSWDNIFTESFGAERAALSPDGRWVAVTALTSGGRGIYLVSTEEVPGVRQCVEGRSPAWDPTGRGFAYLHDGDIWFVNRDCGEPRRITRDEADERAAVVSPNGARIAFYSSRSGHQDIWLVSAAGGTPRKLTEKAMSIDDPRFAPAWSPDSKRIAYISNADDYWEDALFVVDVDTGETRKLSSSLMASSTPAFSPDGKTIALLGTAKNEYWYEDLAYIYLVDAKTGAERVVDMEIFATDWLHNHGVFWSSGGTTLYFIYHERGDLDVWAVPVKGGVASRVSNMGGAVRSFDVSAEAVALVRSAPTRGYDVDYIASRGGPPRRLTRFATSWESLQEPREISYRSFDDLFIQAFLYLPPDFDESQKYPALVNVHGGGTNSYLRRENLIEQALAERGYMVVAINYRGGSGFGRRFQELSINDWANGQAKDAAAAADFIRTLPYSNGKIGIYGYSYGGIMTMATIARSPASFDAAVPMAGIYDFGDAYENADRLGRIFIKTGHGGAPEERPDIYAVSDTLARLDAIRTPLLIMHGEEDVRAPFRQYVLAVEKLQRTGKLFEQKSYPGEAHGFRNPSNRIDMYQRLEAFFARYLR